MKPEKVKIEASLISHAVDEVNILQYIDGNKLFRLYLSNNFDLLLELCQKYNLIK
jgi:hypothetical protein